jgi:hypothetical protein
MLSYKERVYRECRVHRDMTPEEAKAAADAAELKRLAELLAAKRRKPPRQVDPDEPARHYHRLSRFSFQRGRDKANRGQRIDFTKANEDPGFADIIELYGPHYAWRACIAACERELASPDISAKQRMRYLIAKDNAEAMLNRLPED